MSEAYSQLGAGQPEIVIVNTHGCEDWSRYKRLFPKELLAVVEEYLAISADRGADELTTALALHVHRCTGCTVRVHQPRIHRGLGDVNRLLPSAFSWLLPLVEHLDEIRALVTAHREAQTEIWRSIQIARLVIDVHTMSPRAPRSLPRAELSRVAEHVAAWRNADGADRPIDVVSRIEGEALIPEVIYRTAAQAFADFGTVAFDEPYSPTRDFLNGRLGRERPMLSFDIPKPILAGMRLDNPRFDLATFSLDHGVIEAIAEALAGAIDESLRMLSRRGEALRESGSLSM